MNGMGASISRLTKLCMTESNKMIIAVILTVNSFLISIVPYYMIYKIIVEIDKANPEMSQIVNYAIVSFAAIFIRVTFFATATSLSHKAAFEILYKLRGQIAEKLLTLPLGYFNNKDVGAIKKTINEDVEKIELYIAHNVPEIIGALVLPIVTTIFLFIMDWRMALATIAILHGYRMKNYSKQN